MNRKNALLGVGLVLSLICFRLGMWQKDRLEQRRATNSEVVARQDMAAVQLPVVRGDVDGLHFRRALARGEFDYDYEVVVIAKQVGRRPGVHILTPLVMDDGSAVLVNRGWTPSPDGATVDLTQLRGPDSAMVEGYLIEPVQLETNRSNSDWPLRVRYPNLAEISRLIPYSLQPVILRAVPAPSVSGAEVVAVAMPPLSEGSHFSYAVQWFIFGTVALLGAAVLCVW